MGRLIDLVGKKFGRWTVIKRGEDRYDKRGYTIVTWDCICDCGAERNVIGGSLRDGTSKSCGCLQRERVNEAIGKRDGMLGNKFGRWTVLKEHGILHDTISWWCKCECGTEREVTGTSLRNGSSSSCGCYTIERTKEVLGGRKIYNKYDLISEEYAIGYTSAGNKFTFDKEDYDLIYPYLWSVNPDGYLIANDSNGKIFRLHRLVMGVGYNDSEYVDHIDHDISNNQKGNLRLCTPSENAMNQSLKSNNTSGARGVCWDKSRGKWITSIMVNYKSIYIGRYDDFDDAVMARKEAENKHFGEFSYNNSMQINDEEKKENE